MALLSCIRATLILVLIAQTAAGALVKRDTPKVFVPQRVNIPIKQGSAGQYVMPVNMATGDNTQHFNFTMSMSTGLTIVAGQGCSSCSSVPTYDQDKSTTAQSLNANVSTNFFSDITSGTAIKETCSIQTSNGSSWVYPNQTVVVIQNQNTTGLSQILGNADISGLVGLGTNLAQQSSTQGGIQPGLNDSIYGQWLHNNPTALNFTFGMALQPPTVRRNNASATNSGTSSGDGTGVLNWLQPDSSMYQPDKVVFKTANNAANGTAAGNNGSTLPANTPSQEWSLSLDGWKLTAGDDIITNSKQVVASVEALYTELYFPQDQARLIHAAIPGSQLHTDMGSLGAVSQAWTIPCDATFSFGFVVGGQTFTLDHNSLVIPVSGGQCVSAIEAWSDENETSYMLGTVFIGAVYLIFQITRDGQQIVGFAPFAVAGNKSHTGAIVGGVVGGVALIIFVAIGTFFLSRRYHRRSTLGTFDPQLDESKAAPTPYTLGAPTQDARYSVGVPAGSVYTRQSYMPVSPGHSSADALFMEVSSAGSQYAGESMSPPAYDASEAVHNASSPGAAAVRPPIREKGNYSRGSLSQNGATGSGAGPSA